MKCLDGLILNKEEKEKQYKNIIYFYYFFFLFILNKCSVFGFYEFSSATPMQTGG